MDLLYRSSALQCKCAVKVVKVHSIFEIIRFSNVQQVYERGWFWPLIQVAVQGQWQMLLTVGVFDKKLYYVQFCGLLVLTPAHVSSHSLCLQPNQCHSMSGKIWSDYTGTTYITLVYKVQVLPTFKSSRGIISQNKWIQLCGCLALSLVLKLNVVLKQTNRQTTKNHENIFSYYTSELTETS